MAEPGSSEAAPPAPAPLPGPHGARADAAGAGATPRTAAAEPRETDPARSPETDWSPWTAPVALLGGLVLAALGGLIVDLPALALGVRVTASHTPAGLAIADTFVQDGAFVLAAVLCARLGGRLVRAWQLGLRRPGEGWRSASGMIVLLLLAFIALSIAWAEALNPSKERLLQQLGSNESALLLVLSAALTCVAAPMAEEVLFRGYIFTALRNWRGTAVAALLSGLLFGAVHAGSAPLLDLAPLAALGIGLCLLYRHTGSLYPCMVAHCLNNCIAFTSLEGWGWQVVPLTAGSLLAMTAVVRAAQGAGLIPITGVRARRVAT